MYLANVVGTVVSTTKDASLSGMKLLIIERLTYKQVLDGTTEVVVDTVGAGIGETVLVSRGSAARNANEKTHSVIDGAIVAIVDTIELADDSLTASRGIAHAAV